MNPLLRELILAQRCASSPVSGALLLRVGLDGEPRYWGVDWVEAEGGLYRPVVEGGRAALIHGVWQHGGLIDLVATSLETRAMRRRKGLGTLMGEDSIDAAVRCGRVMPVFADGVSWLAHGCQGVVILDWDDAAWQLADIAAFACETEALALRLKRAFADGSGGTPSIFVPAGKQRECRDAA
jgi:hypothetical protein